MSEQHARISNTFFTNLINRLGLRPPFSDGFEMSNTVLPVSIVDQDFPLTAVSTPPIFGAPFSAGRQVAPAINTVLADTTGLAAGNWAFLVMLTGGDAAAATFIEVGIQHRNAANGANIWEQTVLLFGAGGNNPLNLLTVAFSKSMVASERLRLIMNTGGSAGSVYHANIFALQLS